MILLDLTKSSEVRKAADQPNNILESRLQENSLLRGMIIVSFVTINCIVAILNYRAGLAIL